MFIFILLWTLGSAQADLFSKVGSDDYLAYCTLGPRVRVLSAVAKGKGNACEGTAQVQALRWECQAPGKVTETVETFRQNLNDLAKEACAKHCAGRANGCVGRFQARSHCGLETDSAEAQAAGKKFGCKSDCGGQYFAFCSLYDAGYRMEDATMLARQSPNCECLLSP